MDRLRTRSLIGVATLVLAIALGIAASTAGRSAADTGATGGAYVAVTPTRLMDTTTGTGGFTTGFGAGVARSVTVTGVAGVPSTGVSAVVLNVTVPSATDDSVMDAYPAGGARAAYGFLRYGPTTVPASNTTIVAPGSNGQVTLYNSAGTAQVKVDVEGYFTTAGSDTGYHTMAIQRLGSSIGSGTGGIPAGPLPGGTVYTVAAGGVGNVPADATAIFANVRVVNATGSGGMKIYASNASAPSVAQMNYNSSDYNDAGMPITLGPDGKFKFYSSAAASTNYDITIDIEGYFEAGTGATFHPINGIGLFDGRTSAQKLAPGASVAHPNRGCSWGLNPPVSSRLLAM